MNLSKRAIVMGINDQFRRMPKKQVAMIYYRLLKAKLPLLPYEETKMKMLGRYKKLKFTEEIPSRRKTKRKFSRKQLAAQRLFAKRARAGTLRRRRR